MSRVRAVFALACLLGSGALVAQTPRRYALLIGLNDYYYQASGITPLNYAINDVNALRERLKGSGFDYVEVLTNLDATRSGIVRKLYDYARKVNPQDTFVLYFAGHGVLNKVVNEETYWLTFDAKLEPLDEAGIRLTHLLDLVRDIDAEKKLLLLDHCFSGEVQKAVTEDGDGNREGTGSALGLVPARGSFRPNEFRQRLESRASGMVILAAAREGAQESAALKSIDAQGRERSGHGLFTYTLLQALGTRLADTAAAGQTPDGKLTMAELAVFLDKEMPEIARKHGLGDQKLTEVTGAGVNTSTWEIIPSLPIDDLQQRVHAAKTYRDTLRDWEDRGLIDFDTRIECLRVLTLWEEALKDGPALAPKDEEILEELRKHLDSDAPEDILAQDLVTEIKLINKHE